jgi:UDP-N-acetylenolpyruvoylglucosamine reductase
VNIERDVALGRLTTVGIGGPARHFARPRTLAELEEVLRWAAAEAIDVLTIGLGSNVLVADEGVDALVLRLEGELAVAETMDTLLVAGGGAANAVCLHRTRAAGLGGFEFACAIPGTVGGGVRMNAGAYGGDWRGILERALVVSPEGSGWRTADELQQAARRSTAEGERMGEYVRWIRSYVIAETDGSLGTVCVYQALSPEAIRRHAYAATLPVDEIVAVAETVVVRPDPVPATA